MILYIESKAFPYRSFVVRVLPSETIARVRAQILHILYELGREDHQFRLRHKGEYLRDAYTVEDYGIIPSSVIKMIPLSRNAESTVDLHSMDGSMSTESGSGGGGGGIRLDVKQALEQEVKVFEYREKLIFHFKGLNYIHFLWAWLAFLTTYWYAGLWGLAIWLLGELYCPTFTRFSGFVGRHSIYKNEFCLSYGVLSIMAMVIAVFFCMTEWTRVVSHGCKDWVFVDDCSYQVVFSAVFFAIQAVCFLVSSGLVWNMVWNFKLEYGDFVEKYLVQSRDIEAILHSARKGNLKERRAAAFELATMAASGDDNKFRIVAEGGLEVLLRLAVHRRDVATQEHAVEALAELLTVPAIQDAAVDQGGTRALTALLHSPHHRLVYQAATALSYIVADSDDNKFSVVADHGLEDLAYAAHHAHTPSQRLVAAIYLDLAFNADVRMQMASLNTPAQALIVLSASSDPDTQRYALQTLELLAIESGELIRAQDELLALLLALPLKTVDSKVYLLAGKILLYFAEDRDSCEKLQDLPNCKESLLKYARTNDPVLQKVVCKIIYCMLEAQELRYRARHLELGEVLTYIRDNAADRECWDNADQALQALTSDDDLQMTLPPMSAAEKLNKMDPEAKVRKIQREFGSRASLGSRTSLRSSTSTDSVVRAKKELQEEMKGP